MKTKLLFSYILSEKREKERVLFTMSKKINHYKLESIRKECDTFLLEKEELLSWYKQQSKQLNKVETRKDMLSLLFQLKEDMVIARHLRQIVVEKLEKEDYNISKGVIALLDEYDEKVDSLSSSYNEQLQKINLLVKNLDFEYEEARRLAYEEQLQKDIEEEEEPYTILSFLSHNIKFVVAFVLLVVLIFVAKMEISKFVDNMNKKWEDMESPVFTGQMDF